VHSQGRQPENQTDNEKQTAPYTTGHNRNERDPRTDRTYSRHGQSDDDHPGRPGYSPKRGKPVDLTAWLTNHDPGSDEHPPDRGSR
jgi:hypothetical protein